MGRYYQHQTDIACLNYLRIAVEDGEQWFSPEKNGRDCHSQDADAFSQTEQQRFFEPLRVAGSEVLADEGGAGLAEGVENVVGEDFYVVGCAGRCHDDGSQTVDSRLDHNICYGEYCSLNSGRQADLKNTAEACGVDPQAAGFHADFQFRVTESAVQNQ